MPGAALRKSRRQPRTGNRQRGLLLIESLITLSIAAVALSALLKFQIALYRAGNGAEQRADALAVAERTVEALQTRIRAGTMPAASGSDTVTVSPAGAELPSGISYERQWLLTPAGAALRIDVLVHWIDDRAIVRSITLSSAAAPSAALASGALIRKPPFLDPP